MKKNTEEKMVQKRRVVITGLGAVTPIGNTVPEFWTNVRKGTVGIGEITGFDTKDFKVKLAAQVKISMGKRKWMQKRQGGWNCFPSMQSQLQRKPWRMPASI